MLATLRNTSTSVDSCLYLPSLSVLTRTLFRCQCSKSPTKAFEKGAALLRKGDAAGSKR
jgi:hypothetical protein